MANVIPPEAAGMADRTKTAEPSVVKHVEPPGHLASAGGVEIDTVTL